jgi:hypothetical protein
MDISGFDTGTPVSGRHAVAFDAYEEVLLLRDLLDRLSAAESWAERQAEEQPHPFYLAMNAENVDLFTALWYVEVSYERVSEAQRALSEAVEKYAAAFEYAALGRSDLGAVLRRQGLPDPTYVAREAVDRRRTQPWWRRKRHLGFYGLGPGEILDKPPADSKYFPLNVPDPSAAIAFWRRTRKAPN